MDKIYWILAITLFILALHVLCNVYPIFRTYVKYSKNNEYVNYKVFFFKFLAIEATYSIFEWEDVTFIRVLSFVNMIINLRITIL